MHWIYLLIAAILMFAAMMARLPGWLVFLMMLGSLVAAIAWIVGWMSARISSGARSEVHILSPDELRVLREQAEARRNSSSADSEDAAP
ncbi:hypothetical protein [Arenimonas oryziterrae]|uniref:Uncharacterized protein n=1 Tax=Arenimonas oryziterrae DSM 21050 = YC6267 TaxID=1121015 RepID=A0A091AYQ0_9GAMM|nr:hypothetical protein [Arenimonas oryziterrae]KFN43794.1 hypothetical protein N789_07565 [Arenimonas oryziterrae DSM 21050 = YC6267]